MRRAHLALAMLVLSALPTLFCGGCGWLFRRDPAAPEFNTNQRMNQGLVLVLPGIEGTSHLNKSIRDGLAEGGVPTAIRIHDWTLGPTLALVSEMWEGRARQKASELASVITAYKIQHPGKGVVIVGHSGGCAVAVFALERLPANVNVDSVILLAPSIGTDYNLAPALAHIDGVAYAYYSEKDVVFLGLSTWLFGNMDGRRSASAGRDGFTVPKSAADLYARKLKQVKWEPEMEMANNHGGHTDWANELFVHEYIAPRVIAELAAHDERNRPKLATSQPDLPANRVIIYRPPVVTPPKPIVTPRPTTQPKSVVPPKKN